jgi:hypothetical protein
MEVSCYFFQVSVTDFIISDTVTSTGLLLSREMTPLTPPHAFGFIPIIAL